LLFTGCREVVTRHVWGVDTRPFDSDQPDQFFDISETHIQREEPVHSKAS